MRLLNWKHQDMARMGLTYRFLHPMVPWWHNFLTRMRVKGAENVPDSGAVILAVQHLSWWDPIVVSASLERPVHYLAKREVIAGPLTDRFFRSGGVIPVDRNASSNEEAVRKSLEVLDRGGILGVFPEGTRGTLGEPRVPKTGMARLALLTGAPVVPVCPLTDRLWGKDRRVPKLGEPVYVRFGEPVVYGKDLALAKDKEVCRKITDEIFGRVLDLRDEAIAAREGKERWRRVVPRAFLFPGEETVRRWVRGRET